MTDIAPSAYAYARENVLRGVKRGWFPHPDLITAEWIDDAFSRAGKTLVSLRVTGTRPADMGCAWPDVVRESIESYGWTGEVIKPPIPPSNEIEWMDQVYSWLGLLPEGRKLWRRLIALRGLTHPIRDDRIYSLRKLAKMVGCDEKSCRNWIKLALEGVRTELRTIIDNSSSAPSARSATKFPRIEPEVGIALAKAKIMRPLNLRNGAETRFRQGDIISEHGAPEREYYIVWSITLGVVHAIPLKSYRHLSRVPVDVVFDGDDPEEGENKAYRIKRHAAITERRHFAPSQIYRYRASVGDAVVRIGAELGLLSRQPRKRA